MSAPRSSLGLGSLLVALVIILALGVGTVYAAIPNGNGTYYACLTKSSGVIRLINYPKVKCAKGERFIKWNQQGPQGPKGDPGPADWNAIPNKPAGFADATDDAGVTGVKVTRVVELASLPIGPTTGIVQALCPAGSVVVGGGFSYFGNVTVVFSFDLEDGSGWKVGVGKPSGETAAVYSIAKCLSVEPSGAFTTAKKGVKVATKPQRQIKRDR
jgi:hypothetical protein